MKRGAILLLLGSTACLAQRERTFERTLHVNGPVMLEVNTDSGGIVVTAGPAGSVHVRGILKAQRGSFGGGNVEDRIRHLAENPPVSQSANTVRAGVTGHETMRGISLRLEIVVPAETQVRARADSGGIRVDGVHGPIDLGADSGGIEAINIGAEVRASADSGGIHIRSVKGPVYARADSGGIDAFDVAGGIDVKTDSGGIHVSQTVPATIRIRASSGGADVKLAPAGGYDLRVKSDSGNITVPEMTVRGSLSEHHREGKVQGGGPVVDIEAGSGNIHIR